MFLASEPEQRLGPSAEMVMIDRMFIQEEKVALNQDRILAKERPGTLGLSTDSQGFAVYEVQTMHMLTTCFCISLQRSLWRVCE